MSVRMTRTWLSLSYARYSAVVSASLGVRILSIEGSEDRLRKSTVLSRAPVSSNCRMKKFASSLVIPMAAKTTEKFSDELSTLACLAI